ncbi:putative BOI-related E3 ubiquitin-protein ligase 3 [Drosera capensis]
MYGSEIGIEPAMLMTEATATAAHGTLPCYNCFADSALTAQLQQHQRVTSTIDFNNVNQLRKRSRDSIGNISTYGTLAVPLTQPDLCDDGENESRNRTETDIKVSTNRGGDPSSSGKETQREKEERIVQSTKLNLALEEKVKQLCLENQIWRELAQANEATANALRTKIEQILSSPLWE